MSTIGWVFILLVILAVVTFLVARQTSFVPEKKPIPESKPVTKTAPPNKREHETALDITPNITPNIIPNVKPNVTPNVTPNKIPNKTVPPPLPTNYGDDKMVALVQSPRIIHLYWDLSKETKKRLETESKRHLVLRINTKDGQHKDILIDDTVNNWYFEVSIAEGTYFATLGMVLYNDSFVEILRSNEVTMPRETISEKVDSEWPPIEGMQYLFGTYQQESMSSPELVKNQ